MNLIHARNCKKGGLIIHGHDYHSHQWAATVQMAWNNVEIEPIMKDADPSKNSPSLQADFQINGIWDT